MIRYFPEYGYGDQPPRRTSAGTVGSRVRFSSTGVMSPKATVAGWSPSNHRTAVWTGITREAYLMPSGHKADYPFIVFQSVALEPLAPGISLYGDEDPTNGWWSEMLIRGAAQRPKDRGPLDYRNIIISQQFDDHPTTPGYGFNLIGVADYTDPAGWAVNAGTYYYKDDSGPGWTIQYGLNHYFYNNPPLGVTPEQQLSIYGDPHHLVQVGAPAQNYNLVVHGVLSKSSGSFDIEHPTVQGRRLRHSFIEGPQADLIYRGTAKLGAAPMVIDMDTEFDMTPGTWEALNCAPWSMVSASGKVVEWEFEGSTLTITGDEGTNCMWMVIGERHDPHMKGSDCAMADAHGHLIVEYDEPEPLPEGTPPPHESHPS